jgi:hypothetical protein
VRPDRRSDWKCLDSLGIDCIVAPTRDLAILSTYTDVVAVSADGSERWRRSAAADGVLISSVEGGLVRGSAELDPPGGWRSFAIEAATGRDAGRDADGEERGPGNGARSGPGS